MLEYTLSELRQYLLDNPELERDLPESYVMALKNFNTDCIESIIPVIEALFNETFEDEEGALVFYSKERYPLEPQFAPNCYYLLQDNNTYRLLSLCHKYFPTVFADYIVAIITHPDMYMLIGEAFEKAKRGEFSKPNGLEIWQQLIDHQRQEKKSQVLVHVLYRFIHKLNDISPMDIRPIPSFEVGGIVQSILEPLEIDYFNRFFSFQETQDFINILMGLNDSAFFAEAGNHSILAYYFERNCVDGFLSIIKVIELLNLNISNTVFNQALNILINNPSEHSSIANIIIQMYYLDFMNENELNSLKNARCFSTLSDLLNMFTTSDIINQGNAVDLFNQSLPILESIAASDAIQLLLIRIEHEHHFQIWDWEEIVNLIVLQSPENELNEFVFNLLNHEDRAEIIFLAPNVEDVLLNDSQSTHTASVHQGVSESAMLLKRNYKIENQKQIISEISQYLNDLDAKNYKYAAALRAYSNLVSAEYDYFDETSKLNLLDILLLTWVAIEDDSQRLGEKKDVRLLWVQALYEIQRDYINTDNPSLADNHICGSGSFNKLIHALVGGHKLVEVNFITMISFAYKLKASVQNLIINHLQRFSNPQNLRAFFYFNQMILDIEINGIEMYWPHIKEFLRLQLFGEFARLFKDINDVKFTGVLETGEFVELENLSRFQKEISASKGYYQFCRANLFHNISPVNSQHEFDKRFGLIKR